MTIQVGIKDFCLQRASVLYIYKPTVINGTLPYERCMKINTDASFRQQIEKKNGGPRTVMVQWLLRRELNDPYKRESAALGDIADGAVINKSEGPTTGGGIAVRVWPHRL